MARQSVTTQLVTRTGTVPSAGSPNVDGDIIDTGASVFLILSNTGGSPATVVVQSQATFDGLAVEDLSVSLAAGATKVVGPISPVTFGFPKGDTNAGRAFVDYTGTVADIKRSVLSL